MLEFFYAYSTDFSVELTFIMFQNSFTKRKEYHFPLSEMMLFFVGIRSLWICHFLTVTKKSQPVQSTEILHTGIALGVMNISLMKIAKALERMLRRTCSHGER